MLWQTWALDVVILETFVMSRVVWNPVFETNSEHRMVANDVEPVAPIGQARERCIVGPNPAEPINQRRRRHQPTESRHDGESN